MKSISLILFLTLAMHAQSFYVLTGVDKYDPLISSPPELEIYNEEILEEMRDMSKELGVDIANHPSRVLALIITKFSLGQTIGFKVELELAEYMEREGSKEAVFALSYLDLRTVVDSEDIEDTLMDTVDDMLSKFSHQYKDDNKNLSDTKEGLTHKNFASKMAYETTYADALMRAKKEGKKLFIFMHTSYCPWCRKMENRILSKVEIDKKIKSKYVPLILNFSRKNFPVRFRQVAVTPALYVVDPITEKIEHQFVGYASRNDFLHLLDGKRK